ncbi:hypothetical protein LDENG_00218720 [Lucifuga dentata]|nr:hypothetical protein LDENG_00218720 [Lucifuga dentata]
MPSDHEEPVTDAPNRDEPSEEHTEVSTVSSTGWPTSSSAVEVELEGSEHFPVLGEEEELPHMLLPDSLTQLEEFGRHKRPRKVHRGHGKPRLFSDLWVRIGHGTTPPPTIRIINSYVTVEPPLTHQAHRRRMEVYAAQQPSSPVSSTHSNPTSAQPALVHSTLSLSCILVWLLSHMLFTS